jgi:hypothetical protein
MGKCKAMTVSILTRMAGVTPFALQEWVNDPYSVEYLPVL